MNIQDIYEKFPWLMTDMEKQVSRSGENLNSNLLPDFFRETPLINPDKSNKSDFKAREPAFGWTLEQIQELEDIASQSEYSELKEYFVYKELSKKMRRRLICPSGAATVKALCDILRGEKESGVAAAIPSWYKFGKGTGPDTETNRRRFGYQKCENRACYKTEDTENEFLACVQCKIAFYCSKECQTADWKARHKKMCATAKEKHQACLTFAKVINRHNKLEEAGELASSSISQEEGMTPEERRSMRECIEFYGGQHTHMSGPQKFLLTCNRVFQYR